MMNTNFLLLIAAAVDEMPAEGNGSKESILAVLGVLLLGIAAVGVILVIMVVVWGGRTRRLSREGLPEVRDPDPFAGMKAEARRTAGSADASQPDEANSPDELSDEDEDDV